MGFIDDDQVPLATQQAFVGVLDPRDPGNGRNDLVLLLPRVRAVVGAEYVAANHLEVLAEAVFHFPLPLEGEIRRGDDERPLDQPPDLQFLVQQPGHDGLACARIVGQEEANPGHLQEVVVDRLKLVGQRIDAGDGQREVGIVFVGQRQPHGFDAQAEVLGIAVERLFVGGTGQLGQLLGVENRLVDLPGFQSLAHELDGGPHRDSHDNLHRLGENGATNDDCGLQLVQQHNGTGLCL